MANLLERHSGKIGVLSCFDRLLLQARPQASPNPQAVATALDRRGIRTFNYAKEFALPFRDAIRAHAERIAAKEGAEIEYIQRIKSFRKEERVGRSSLSVATVRSWSTSSQRWSPCPTYAGWHDKRTGMAFICRDRGKCLHYYCTHAPRRRDRPVPPRSLLARPLPLEHPAGRVRHRHRLQARRPSQVDLLDLFDLASISRAATTVTSSSVLDRRPHSRLEGTREALRLG